MIRLGQVEPGGRQDLRMDLSVPPDGYLIKDTFRFDMVFPHYFPILSTLTNVRAAEFMQ